MSRKQFLIFLVTLVSQFALAQRLADQIDAVSSDAGAAMIRAADQIDKAQISRSDGIRITAVFMETQAARNVLKQTLADYITSVVLQGNHATRLTKLLTQSEGQLRIIQAAERLSRALDKVEAIASEFSLIAPDASALASQYSTAQNGPVARKAGEVRLFPPTMEQAEGLLKQLQNDDHAFQAAYSAFCERMQKKFGFSFIEEATKAALRG